MLQVLSSIFVLLTIYTSSQLAATSQVTIVVFSYFVCLLFILFCFGFVLLLCGTGDCVVQGLHTGLHPYAHSFIETRSP